MPVPGVAENETDSSYIVRAYILVGVTDIEQTSEYTRDGDDC